MALELIYTSAKQGLKPGSHGFCTVAMTAGMSAALAGRLETMSGYRFAFPPYDPKAHLNPVSFACSTFVLGGRNYTVLSRICSAGFDHTQRSNLLAHHVVLESDPRNVAGPAWQARQPGFFDNTWQGDPHLIDAPKAVQSPQRPAQPAAAWRTLTGAAGWAAVLADFTLTNPNAPVALVFNPGTEMLPLIDEALALLPPERRWAMSYNTYLTDLLAGTTCAWRCMLPSAPMLVEMKRNKQALVLDFSLPNEFAASIGDTKLGDLQTWLSKASDQGARLAECAENGSDAWPQVAPIRAASAAVSMPKSPVFNPSENVAASVAAMGAKIEFEKPVASVEKRKTAAATYVPRKDKSEFELEPSARNVMPQQWGREKRGSPWPMIAALLAVLFGAGAYFLSKGYSNTEVAINHNASNSTPQVNQPQKPILTPTEASSPSGQVLPEKPVESKSEDKKKPDPKTEPGQNNSAEVLKKEDAPTKDEDKKEKNGPPPDKESGKQVADLGAFGNVPENVISELKKPKTPPAAETPKTPPEAPTPSTKPKEMVTDGVKKGKVNDNQQTTVDPTAPATPQAPSAPQEKTRYLVLQFKDKEMIELPETETIAEIQSIKSPYIFRTKGEATHVLYRQELDPVTNLQSTPTEIGSFDIEGNRVRVIDVKIDERPLTRCNKWDSPLEIKLKSGVIIGLKLIATDSEDAKKIKDKQQEITKVEGNIETLKKKKKDEDKNFTEKWKSNKIVEGRYDSEIKLINDNKKINYEEKEKRKNELKKQYETEMAPHFQKSDELKKIINGTNTKISNQNADLNKLKRELELLRYPIKEK